CVCPYFLFFILLNPYYFANGEESCVACCCIRTVLFPQQDSIYQSLQSLVDWFRESIGVPIERKYNSVLFGGLIGSLFSLLQFLSSPLTGAASDYYGRRPLLMLTTAGIMASYALWGVSRSFGVFLLSRVVGGICKGNVSLCTAVVADLPCPKARGRGMAMIGVAFSLGFTVGPMMGAYLGSRASREVFYLGPASLALAFSTADLLFIFAVLPETLRKEKKVASMSAGLQECVHLLSPVSLFNFSAVTQTEQPPTKENMQNLRVLGWVYFSYLFLFSGLEYTLSFLTHQRFQFTGMQQGKMFFFIGITMAIIQGGYARRIKPERQIKTQTAPIHCYFTLFVAAAVVIPCLSTQVSEHGSFSQKGTVMGILRSLGALARAFGPVVASSVYWLAGAETCYIVSSAFFIVPLALLRRLMQPKKE
uniref:Major facilitator superfamily domain containing 10 n=1 Tax=Scleropages formosus TaxID=113540 RepID=A0A8C9TD11_SCLFO